MKPVQFAVLLVVLLGTSEVALRWNGHLPYRLPSIAIRYQPPHCFLPTRLLGVELNPGAYVVTLNEGLVYRATHNERRERVTSLVEKDPQLPEVALLGDSMTYGMGVDDDATYPFLLNETLNGARVANLAIPGTGTVHSYLRLKEYLRLGNRPAVVVLTFLDFHDDRNTYGPQTKEMLRAGTRGAGDDVAALGKDRPWTYAYARIRDESLEVAEEDLHPVAGWTAPLRRTFALINLFERGREQWSFRRVRPAEVTHRLISMTSDLCGQYGCRFLVGVMSRGRRTEDVQAYCSRRGIRSTDLSVDFGDRRFTNYPFDAHPSPLAHQAIAAKLKDFLASQSVHRARGGE